MVFMFIENYDGIIILNWSPLNDEYINYNRIEQIKKFMYNFLKQKNQEGFFLYRNRSNKDLIKSY